MKRVLNGAYLLRIGIYSVLVFLCLITIAGFFMRTEKYLEPETPFAAVNDDNLIAMFVMVPVSLANAFGFVSLSTAKEKWPARFASLLLVASLLRCAYIVFFLGVH